MRMFYKLGSRVKILEIKFKGGEVSDNQDIEV